MPDLQAEVPLLHYRPLDVQGDRPAHHHVGELLGIGVLGGHIADVLPLAQHCHPVGDGHDLVELVGDNDHGLAVRLHVAQHVEEAVGLLGGEDGGGLIQDEDVGPAVEDLDDLHRLLLGYRHVVDLLVRVHLEAVLGTDLPDASGDRLEIQPPLVFQPEGHVFGGGEHVHQLEVLVDHADAQVEGVLGGADGDGVSVHRDLALVREIDAREHVHQRGLAAAVLSQQGEDLPLADVQVHPVVGHNGAEGLGDAPHLDYIYGCQAIHPFSLAFPESRRGHGFLYLSIVPKWRACCQALHCGLWCTL